VSTAVGKGVFDGLYSEELRGYMDTTIVRARDIVTFIECVCCSRGKEGLRVFDGMLQKDFRWEYPGQVIGSQRLYYMLQVYRITKRCINE